MCKPCGREVKEPKTTIKDLGVMIDCDMKYHSKLQKAVAKTNAKASWVLHTFECREISFMRKLWKALLQCHMDYGRILWSLVGRKGDLRLQQGPLKSYTKRGKGLYNLNYWQRLEIFKLSLLERCTERYKIQYNIEV